MDIEIINSERERLDFQQLRLMMGWSFGDRGRQTADLWQALNQLHFRGSLDPTPIWFPQTSPYGRWVGLCTGNHKAQTQHIQIVYGQGEQERANILLHEMIHQYLLESRLDASHNALPWCNEIMRLSQEIWGVKIWASPSEPRKRPVAE